MFSVAGSEDDSSHSSDGGFQGLFKINQISTDPKPSDEQMLDMVPTP